MYGSLELCEVTVVNTRSAFAEAGTYLTVGLKPHKPFICAGIRIEPPISVPQPIIDACRARSTPSPPVEPPGVKLGSRAFVVKPQSGFSVSHHYAGKLKISYCRR